MPRFWLIASSLLCVLLLSIARPARADLAATTKAIQSIPAEVLSKEQKETASRMLGDDLRRRLKAANAKSSAEWHKLASKEEWEKYRKEKLALLAASLGPRAQSIAIEAAKITGRFQGDGFRIDNILFSDGTYWVSANLYMPAKQVASPPGIVIGHSHHTSKSHGELQDMGMTWARAGCAVLVIDHLGYGDRVVHPFTKAEDYPAAKFALDRQSYYFRYDTALELSLVGESLVGCMAGDLRRGVTLLLEHAKCDPKRIILLGGVAGGGDPVAVAGALDERISCVGPFNFGGPQPETKFPLPEDAETSFNYAGGGGWESTRNLFRSAGDGFLPWVIVGSIAPRRLIYGHEFSWDEPRDPVWKRFTQIYQWEGAPENQAVAHGRGLLSGQPPEATHCGHIGKEHRKMIHPALDKWFGIQVGPEGEYSQRRPGAELRVVNADVPASERPSWSFVSKIAEREVAEANEALAKLPRDQRRGELKRRWAKILGPVDPPAKLAPVKYGGVGGILEPVKLDYSQVVLEPEPGIHLPLLLIPGGDKKDSPCVVAFAQAGKEAFLEQRATELAKLHEGGVAVCLVDLRGTGETRDDSDRDQYSAATDHSSSELMLNGTMLGARLRDLRTVLHYLGGRKGIDPQRLSLWGDSFAAVNPPETVFAAPRRIDGRPRVSEPLGQLLCLLAPLFEDDLRSVYFAGGIVSWREVVKTPYIYVPHDAVVPGMLTCGDIETLASARRCRTSANHWVDAYNRRVDPTPFIPMTTSDGAGPFNAQLEDPAEWLIRTFK